MKTGTQTSDSVIKDKISSSLATNWPKRQERGHFSSLRSSRIAPAGTFPEEHLPAGPCDKDPHLTRSSVQACETEIKFSSHGWRNWSSHELTSLFRFTSLMSSKARIQTQDCPDPEPDLPPPVMWPVVLDSATEFGSWKVTEPKMLAVQRNQKVGRKRPCGHNEMNPSPRTFEESGFPALMLPSRGPQWGPALYSFYPFVNKIHSYPRPASRVVQMKYIMSVIVFEHIKGSAV